MRIVVVWKENTDYARVVREWLREFKRRTGRDLESLDPESLAGESFARAYDIVEYPTVIAMTDEGKEQQRWAGRMLPKVDDVNYYAM